MSQIVLKYSWYYVQSAKLLCIGPAGHGTAGDWYELEDATPYLERGHSISGQWDTPRVTRAMENHAAEIRVKWHIPEGATIRREVPYNPALPAE